jgi:hypothetical protein
VTPPPAAPARLSEARTRLAETVTAITAERPDLAPGLRMAVTTVALRAFPDDPETLATLDALDPDARCALLAPLASQRPPTPALAQRARAVALRDPTRKTGLYTERVLAVWAGASASEAGFDRMAQLDRARGLIDLVRGGWAQDLDALRAFTATLPHGDDLSVAAMAWCAERVSVSPDLGVPPEVESLIDAIPLPAARLEAFALLSQRRRLPPPLAARALETADAARAEVEHDLGLAMTLGRRAALVSLAGDAPSARADLDRAMAAVAHVREPLVLCAVWKELARAAACIGVDAWEAVLGRIQRDTRGQRELSAWRGGLALTLHALPRLAFDPTAFDRGREAALSLVGRPPEPGLQWLLDALTARFLALTPGRSAEATLAAVEARLRSQPPPLRAPHAGLTEIVQTLATAAPDRTLAMTDRISALNVRFLWLVELVVHFADLASDRG